MAASLLLIASGSIILAHKQWVTSHRTSERVLLPAGARDKDLQENWQRVSTAFPALESAYFAQREAVLERHARQTEHAQQGQELDVRSSPDDHLQAFSKDLSHFCRHSKLTVWLFSQLSNYVLQD